jgi:hypothetical protein
MHPNAPAQAIRALVNHQKIRDMDDLQRALELKFQEANFFDELVQLGLGDDPDAAVQ